MMYSFLFVVLFAAGTLAQITYEGRCDQDSSVIPKINFSVVEYTGLWYDIEKYPQVFQPGECSSALYTLNPNYGIVSVYNTNVFNGRTLTINGSASLTNVDGIATLAVTFPVEGVVPVLYTNSPYWVLETDYANYALVYSCTQINGTHRNVSAWKLSRTQTLRAVDSAIITSLMAIIPTLNQTNFVPTLYTPLACDSSTLVLSSIFAVVISSLTSILLNMF